MHVPCEMWYDISKKCTLHDCDSLVHYHLTTSISYVKFNFTEISWECFWERALLNTHCTTAFKKPFQTFALFSKRFLFTEKESTDVSDER